MEAQQYNVIFLGPDHRSEESVNRLKEELKNRFQLSDAAVTKMLRLAPVTVKKGLSVSEAARYQEALEAIGASIEVEPVDSASLEVEDSADSVPSVAASEGDGTFNRKTFNAPGDTAGVADQEAGEDELYKVILMGLRDDTPTTAQAVKETIHTFFGTPEGDIDEILQSPPVILADGITYNEAIDHWVELESAGGWVKLEPMNNAGKKKDFDKSGADSDKSQEKPGVRKLHLVGLTLALSMLGMLAATWFLG